MCHFYGQTFFICTDPIKTEIPSYGEDYYDHNYYL